MPQLKKVVLAMGDRLIYRDTFEQALAELTGVPTPSRPSSAAAASAPSPPAAPTATNVPALAERVRRIRDQAEELVRELESLEKEAGKK
jgi:uncharacterized membrane protein (UPF0182 family)